MSPEPVPFHAWLVDKMDKADLNRTTLAAEMTRRGAKVSRQAVAKWCDGSTYPARSSWRTLAAVLGASRRTVADLISQGGA